MSTTKPDHNFVDPNLTDLYWKWCSRLYPDFLEGETHEDQVMAAHRMAMRMTKKFREEILSGKGHDEETSRDQLQD